MLAAADMDHPGWVVEEVDGRTVRALFMGGLMGPYSEPAPVLFFNATGLRLPFGNYHNRVDIDGVGAGITVANLGLEEISLVDSDGLVKWIRTAVSEIDNTAISWLHTTAVVCPKIVSARPS